eukprot:478748_1
MTMYSGFISVNESVNGSLFYWFVESLSGNNPSKTPLLVWLNGGPGASSLFGFFSEQGPFRINKDAKTLSFHSDTWANKYHMLFVDQPINTGFSFCDKGKEVTNEDLLGSNFVTFLSGFYECHPEYASNPLYITGESYAGRYIPFIAKWIISKGTNMNLKGLAIGNGHYDPNIMVVAGPNYAFATGILDAQQHEYIANQVKYGMGLVDENNITQCNMATDIVLNVTNNIYSIYGGNIFQYDIRVLNAAQFDIMSDNIASYLAMNDTVEAIHSLGIEWKDSDGTTSDNPVFDALKCDVVLNNSAILIPQILGSGVRILFYNGQFDGSIWGNIGNQACLAQFNYKGTWNGLQRKAHFTNVNGNGAIVSGYVKHSEEEVPMLTYFVISNSGHLVPYDQPENSLDMITTWIENTGW